MTRAQGEFHGPRTPTTSALPAYVLAFCAQMTSSASPVSALASLHDCRPTVKRPARKRRSRTTNSIASDIGGVRLSRSSGSEDAISTSGSPPPSVATLPHGGAGSAVARAFARSPPAAAACPVPATLTHTRPPPTATPRGVPGTVIVAVTWLLAGSIRVTVPRRGLTAHTAPAPTAIPSTPSSTSTVRATRRLGSMRHTVPPPVSVAHTASSPIASASTHSAATGTRRRGRPVSGSSRVTRPSASRTHTCPSPVAIAHAWIERCVASRPEARSSRCTQPGRVIVHTAPLPTAISSPGGTRRTASRGAAAWSWRARRPTPAPDEPSCPG